MKFAKWLKTTNSIALFFSLSASFLFINGCNVPSNHLIEQVNMEVSPNLETVTLTVSFTRNIQTDLLGDFSIGQYGNLFLHPSTLNTPFQIGFRLNTSIVNDQDLVRLTPVTTFPNGVNLPMLLDSALVQINLPNPAHAQFDIFAYVDVFKKQWLGNAVVLIFVDGEFPQGLAISQGFFRGPDSQPAVYVSAFGPRLQNGSVLVPGGLAVFGNIKRMTAIHQVYMAKSYRSYTSQALKTNQQDTIPLY